MFKRFTLFAGALAALVLFAAAPASAQSGKAAALEVWGFNIKGATREQVRAALRDAGMQVTREDDGYWADQYDASGVLDGATKLSAVYSDDGNGTLGFIQITMPSRMDAGQITRIAEMINARWERKADDVAGNLNVGDAKVTWNFPDGTRIVAERGWPNTTTYVTFSDIKAHRAIHELLREREQAEKEQKAKKMF